MLFPRFVGPHGPWRTRDDTQGDHAPAAGSQRGIGAACRPSIATLSNVKRYPSLGDVGLFVRSLPLAREAQGVRHEPLPDVVTRMARSQGRVADPVRAKQASARACGRYARWFGGLNTCLTRSLVAGALLCSRYEVVLHVGFRPGSDEVPVDGHAWLTVDGVELGVLDEDDEAVPFTGVLEIPFRVEKGSEE